MRDSYFSNMQVWRGVRTSGMIDENMLLNAGKIAPQQIVETLSIIMGTKFADYGSGLDLITGGLGNKKSIELTAPYFEWHIDVMDERPVNIVAAYTSDTTENAGLIAANTANVGKNLAFFFIDLDEQMFGPGAIIELDYNIYQLRVVDAPMQMSAGFRYRVQIANGDPAATIPGQYLIAGKQVSRAGRAYEEGSDEADIVSYNTGMKFRSCLTTHRVEGRITGDAKTDVCAYATKEPETGKSWVLWADMQMWKLVYDLYKIQDYQAFTDQTTMRPDGSFMLKGKNGRPVKRGSGIYEQIAPAHVAYYTKLSADILDAFTMELSYGLKSLKECHWLVLTGYMGFIELDRALREKAGAMGITTVDTHFINGKGQDLILGGQFTGYRMTNNRSFTMKMYPILDDENHCRIRHPQSLKPITSYKMIWIDTTPRNGQANVVKVHKKDREFLEWVIPGSTTPSGGQKSSSSFGATSLDGYSVQLLTTSGQVILDPRGCGILEYDPTGLVV